MWLIQALPKPSLKSAIKALRKPPEMLLEASLNRLFSEEISDGDFAPLQDRYLRVHINKPDTSIVVSFDGLRLRILSGAIKEDVRISAGGRDYLRMLNRKVDPDTLFFQRRMTIEGDTELGLTIKNLLDATDIDRLPELFRRVLSAIQNLEQHLVGAN